MSTAAYADLEEPGVASSSDSEHNLRRPLGGGPLQGAAAKFGACLSLGLALTALAAVAPRRSPPPPAARTESLAAAIGEFAPPAAPGAVPGSVPPAAPGAAGDPNWGCGLLGKLPGVSQDGVAVPETQRLIDGLKSSSTFNKVSYWNWNLAPQTDDGTEQHLTSDFIFMPEQWGAAVVTEKYVRQANVANFLDSNGKTCPATMGDIFLGMNEPDIIGSCMGNMFGECSKSCDQASIAGGDCPACHLHGEKAHANAKHQCNCWQYSYATGVGFWPFKGCSGDQPLPQMWADPGCVGGVMDAWRETARIAVSKGYKYLTTPLVAENMDFAKQFLEHACATCHDASCGCPQYVGFHFYAYDCQPEANGGYTTFKQRLDAAAAMMEQYPWVKGAIINEVGMLNCAGEADNPICVPDSGKYPASAQADHSCPVNSELPNGMGSFIDKLFDLIIAAKTSDGRAVVKGFSWFNENQAGGTYNLQLFDAAGKLNQVGEAYIQGCTRWGQAQSGVAMKK